MSFGGHDESTGSLNNGNYRELLECFGKFDSVFQRRLHGRLEKFEGVFSRVSADIQNDLIKSIDAIIQDQIDREVEECKFISIQVDETTEISTKEQVNANIRLDKKEDIVERFLKFYITAIIKDWFKKYGSSIQKKFSMQTYDGASVMSGHIAGAQTLVKPGFHIAVRLPATAFCHLPSLRYRRQIILYGNAF